MRLRALAGAVSLALAALAVSVRAQDAAGADTPDAVVTEENVTITQFPPPRPAAAATEDDALLSADELDALVAPVALYPDSLLTQVLVASTYPLDIIKADRFLGEQKDRSDKDRAAEAEQQDWDPSVQVLAGAFPTVIQRMAAEVDWTEDLGDAMLAQTDDVLDAVQRQRARAAALGNLTTNDAQVVEEEGDDITITPAQDDVVYVPQYDATTTYTMPYTQPAVITTDSGYSNLITTGAIAFGSALLISEIFDDDDGWDDYWHHHDYDHIDWDEGDLRPNRDIDINGDVNIDRDRTNVIGDRDRTRIGDREGTWQPDSQRQAEARDRLSQRKAREGGLTTSGAQDKLAARGDGRGIASQDISRKLSQNQELSSLKPRESAFAPKNLDVRQTRDAVSRGQVSKNKGAGAKSLKSNPKGVSRATSNHTPQRKSASNSSAFKKQGGGGGAKAAKARGGRSQGGRGGGGGGRRR